MAAVSVESFDCTKRITGSLQERLVGRLETSLEITIFTLRDIHIKQSRFSSHEPRQRAQAQPYKRRADVVAAADFR